MVSICQIYWVNVDRNDAKIMDRCGDTAIPSILPKILLVFLLCQIAKKNVAGLHQALGVL